MQTYVAAETQNSFKILLTEYSFNLINLFIFPFFFLHLIYLKVFALHLAQL